MPAYHPAELHALFLDAFNRGDVRAVVALYEPNALLLVGGESAVGSSSIRAAFERALAGRGHMTLERRHVHESPNGVALLHASWVIEYPNEADEESTTRGLSSEVVRKQTDGTWLFVIDNPYSPCSVQAKQGTTW